MAVLAIYGARLRQGFTQKQAFDYTKAALASTRSHPSTSQAAMEQFQAGIGDILFNYEVAGANHQGATVLNVIYPNRTIMTEPVAVAIQNNITTNQADIITAFLEFLWSDVAQKKLSEFGFQTINTAVQPQLVPTPSKDIFTLDSLGNALDLNRNIIDPLVAQN